MRLSFRQWFLLSFVLLLSAGFALAQSERSSIVGRVTDPTGAVVPGTTVTIINQDTGARFEVVTDDTGRFVTPAIFRPGTYRIEAVRDGFRRAVTQPFTVQIGEVREVNLGLEVGAVGDEVTVTAEAPQLQTETSARGDVITGRQIVELPLKDRNFTQLATLTPGVTRALVGALTDQSLFNQMNPQAGGVPGLGDNRGSTEAARFSRSGGAAISANGLRPTNNNFTLDGVDNNEPQFGTIGVFPNPDAIQEFRVETSVAKAEFGGGGATINTTYQSGKNNFHGSIYYYGQNEALNATHAQLNLERSRQIAQGRTPAEAEQQFPKGTHRVHEYGFTVGGPVVRNRTFFFGAYLGQRNNFPHLVRIPVPTAKSRMGDFTEFVNPNTGALHPVLDPQTCNTPGVLQSGGCSPFPGNIIPNLQSHPNFNAAGFAYINAFPLPNVSVANNPSFGNPNFIVNRQLKEQIDAYDVKLDHRFTDKSLLSGRYSQNTQERIRGNMFPGLPTAGFGAGDELGNTRQVAISNTHAFRPTLLNELRLGWTRIELGIFHPGMDGRQGVSPTWCQDIGIPNCNKGTLATQGGMLLGGFGTGEMEFTGDGGVFLVKSSNFYVGDSVTVVAGRHTWKFGGEVRPRYLDTIDGGRSGFLKGHIQYAAVNPGDDNWIATSTGHAQADFMLGASAIFAESGSILGGERPFELRTSEWSFFLQDDWKVTPNLILNLGLRYDLFPSWTEASDRLANYDVFNSRIVRPEDGGRVISTDKNNFAPRAGFAWAFGPGRKSVLRGGYGLFYSKDGLDYPPIIRNPPLTNTVRFDNFGFNQPTFNLATGPPVAPVVDPPVILPQSALFMLEQEQRTAIVHQWNFSWQNQLAQDWVLDIGYAGTAGRHLLATRELGNREAGLGLARTPAGEVLGHMVAYENRALSDYHAMQVKLDKLFARGFSTRVAYTWSHNIDSSSGVFSGAGDIRGVAGGPSNPLDLNGDRARSSLDRRHLFNSAVIWDLPFGRGRPFAADASEGLDKVIGGWQANFIFSGATGQPFGVEGEPGAQGGRSRANLVGDPFAGIGPGQWINRAAFTHPQPGQPGTTCVTNLAGKQVCFGNLRRNFFTGPGFFRTDLSLFKNTVVTERFRLQLGMEFFNIFNHTNRVVPQNFLNDGDFGQFRNAMAPRTVQYRGKIIF